ncbi:16597_t:CDS:2 [Racocetra fulgida]|uniref:16597_t:CDS:1 n=1 Tax=Racocetra fulgida TaxID=60492 RepID=A0A9N8ZFA1_9GLOM|nr:16597_t:CDS:2 [Racocetra fulgida]
MFTPKMLSFISPKLVPSYIPAFRSAILKNEFRSVFASRFGASFREYNERTWNLLNYVAKKYTKEHEWIHVEKDLGTVGITHYAQNSLGDVVYVEVPEIGTVVEQSESVKAASDIYAPVSGEIVEVNKKLEKSPGLINESPEADGI